MKRTQKIGFGLALVVFVGLFFIPESIGLSVLGIKTLGLLIVTIILLATEAFDFAITCILSSALLFMLGVVPNMSAALSGYSNHVVMFVIASFGLSAAFAKVSLSKRLMVNLIKLFGMRIENILFAIMLTAAILSSVMSNVATTAILVNVVKDLLQCYSNAKDKKISGKAFMIGLPIAAILGGMMTPAGNGANLLILEYLEGAGIPITFIEWMAIGIPLASLALLFSWLLIVKVFQPAKISEIDLKNYLQALRIAPRFSAKEKYVSALFIILFIMWVLSSWIPILQITAVTIIGLVFLFIPGHQILSFEEFTRHISWPAYFLLGAMMTFGTALVTNGVSDWIITAFFPENISFGIGMIIFMMGMSVSLILVPIPIAPALISMLAPSFIALANAWGVSPAFLLLPLLFGAVNSLHLPLDTVPLMTYLAGYYKMTDMTKIGVPIEICFNVVMALWLPFIISILGIV